MRENKERTLQNRKFSVGGVCITFLDNYRSPKVIVVVHPSENAHCTIIQAPKSFFLSPLSAYVLWQLNVPELSVLLPLLPLPRTGTGDYFQWGTFQQAGWATPDTMPLALVRNMHSLRRKCLLQIGEVHWVFWNVCFHRHYPVSSSLIPSMGVGEPQRGSWICWATRRLLNVFLPAAWQVGSFWIEGF